jgi:hypothetical protein
LVKSPKGMAEKLLPMYIEPYAVPRCQGVCFSRSWTFFGHSRAGGNPLFSNHQVFVQIRPIGVVVRHVDGRKMDSRFHGNDNPYYRALLTKSSPFFSKP